MGAVVLPSTPAIRSATPQLLDWGGELEPTLGGPVQRMQRLGSRHALAVELPPLKEETDGRIWAARLRQGKVDGVVLPFPQFNLVIGNPGTPTVNGNVIGGTSIPIKGLSAGYKIREGQFLTVIHGGRRYLYSSMADVNASAGGQATVPIAPMLRTALSNNDTIEMNPAKIEGYLQGPLSWDIMLEPFTSIKFVIVERE